MLKPSRHRLSIPNVTPLCSIQKTRNFHVGRTLRNEHATKSSTEPKQPDGNEVTDREWNIRAGRAMSLIRETLPDFFKFGLVERTLEDEQVESIYSPRIQLMYTPPTRLPPFPPTLTIEGLPLYHASSVFVRHTLSMFYTDLYVELRRFQDYKLGARERRFTISFAVLGRSRMGSTKAEWDIASTYHISPVSGQVYKHVVESIHPAPHGSIYETLASALGRLSSFKSGTEQPALPGGAAQTSPVSVDSEIKQSGTV